MDVQGAYLKTLPLNAWAKMKCWPEMKTIKLSDYSQFNTHFRQAEENRSERRGTAIFIGDRPVALALYEYQPHLNAIDFQICTKPQYRRHGLAQRLLRYVALHHRGRDLRVYPHDEASDRFYTSMGVPAKTAEEYFRWSYIINASKIIDFTRGKMHV